ncbi:MAG: hypothetical protein HYS23_04670 [Geobacter sp.]|nr:hypothetical protein [Geobacter sp.]
MELQERIKTTGLELVNSYEKRLKLLNGLVCEAVRRVNGYCREQEELSGQLKENLARHEGMRKKDFDGLMDTVLEKRRQSERETRLSLEKIWQEESEMIELLREALTGNCNLADFERMKSETLSRHRDKEKEVARSLMKFQLEQEELSIVLKKLLSRGREVRVKEFKAMVRTLVNSDGEIGREVDRLLEEFGRIRQEVAAQWDGLFSYYEKGTEQG